MQMHVLHLSNFPQLMNERRLSTNHNENHYLRKINEKEESINRVDSTDEKNLIQYNEKTKTKTVKKTIIPNECLHGDSETSSNTSSPYASSLVANAQYGTASAHRYIGKEDTLLQLLLAKVSKV